MSSAAIQQSQAFKRAVLRSERIRILGIMGVLIAACVMLMFREGQLALAVAYALLGAALAYELAMLIVVDRAIRTCRELPAWTWVLNIAIETLLPTIALVISTTTELVGPYKALVTPGAFFYFFFIILSTLRLRPSLCFLTGLCSSAGYLGVIALTYWRYPEGASSPAAFPLAVYLTIDGFFLVGGFVAGAVADQIRRHVGAALQEAQARERLQRDMSIARSIQQGLLPEHPPDIPGFEVAGWSRPADDTGGDYFDWLALPDGRIISSIADVTGHGIGSALIVAVCRAYFRALGAKDNTLEETVWRVNHLLTYDLPPMNYITIAVGILDPAASQMEMFSAGHGPILFYEAASGTLRDIPADAPPLGLMEEDAESPHTARTIRFSPGDLLVLLTDGFFEWSNARGEIFGLQRLREAVRTHSGLSPNELILELYHEVLRFAEGTPHADDLTIVVLKRV